MSSTGAKNLIRWRSELRRDLTRPRILMSAIGEKKPDRWFSKQSVGVETMSNLMKVPFIGMSGLLLCAIFDIKL